MVVCLEVVCLGGRRRTKPRPPDPAGPVSVTGLDAASRMRLLKNPRSLFTAAAVCM
jgi:hypothetical protein